MLKKEDVIRYSAGIHFSQERLFNAFLREKGIKNISISEFLKYYGRIKKELYSVEYARNTVEIQQFQ